MGNIENESIDENKLAQYLKEGISMKDLINLKKTFISLDEDSDGYIE
jgi:Ca2+-binding EF-hand superfamily protein